MDLTADSALSSPISRLTSALVAHMVKVPAGPRVTPPGRRMSVQCLLIGSRALHDPLASSRRDALLQTMARKLF